MKILQVIDSLDMGGGQSLLVELVPVLIEMGNEITILQLKEASDNTLSKKLIDQGIKIVSLSKNRSYRNPINIFSIIPYLKKYDLVHVHLFPANYWVALAKIISFSKVKLIFTEHSTKNKRRDIKIFKYIDKFIYKRYNQIIACSDKAKETFEEHFKDINCISIPNGISIKKYLDSTPYSKMELVNIPNESFISTMVARFDYPKQQNVIVKALVNLPEHHHVVFVGGKETDEGLLKVKQLAEELKVPNRVHFLYLRSDVPNILKTSDVIIMSSEYEGLSLSSIEGMASGRPFIASNVNGLKEVVKGAGVLFECGNSDELSLIIQKLENDKTYYQEIVNRCLKRASEYNITKVAEKYNNEYKKAYNGK